MNEKKIMKIIEDFYGGKIENFQKDLGRYLYNKLDIDIPVAYVIEKLCEKTYTRIPYKKFNN